MKTFLLLSSLIISVHSKAQAILTKDYIAYELLNPFELGKDQYYYTWIYMGYGSVMNFPITKSGLQNLNDKALHIARLSKLYSPTWDKSVIPDKFKDETDKNIIYGLILSGDISLDMGYIIGDKTMILQANKEYFKLLINDNH